LLHLQPASDINHEISGTLTTMALSDAVTKFEALSYTWGDSRENRTIQLNGKAGYAVTDNLFYALRRLRNRRTERTVWIDAVCINQNDLDEKGHQVAIMGEIYLCATWVVIWIGESEKAEGAEPGVRGSVKVKYWKLYRQPNAVMFTRRVHHFIEAIRKAVPHRWERAWIVQEAACAKHITVMFGPCEMKFYSFYIFLYGVWEDCIYEDEVAKEKVSKADDAVSRIRDIRNRHQKKGRQSITSLLWNARLSQAIVAQDKVYSLLAIMPLEEVEFLRPNCKEAVNETFAKATYVAIRGDKSLDILGWIPFRDAPENKQKANASSLEPDVGMELEIWRNPELPSWAVDFTNVKYSLFDTPANKMLQNVWDDAETDTSYVAYLGNGKLGLKGCFIDNIDTVIQLQETGRSPSSRDEEVLCDLLTRASASAAVQDVIGLFQLNDKRPSRDRDKKKKFSGSKDWYKLELEKKKKDHSLDYLAHGLILWEETADFPPTFPSGYDNSFGLVLGQYDWYGHLEFYGKVTAGKAEIFSTKMGLVGVAPAGVREGDIITILDGAKLPIVLSPYGDRDEGEFIFRGYA